MNIYLDIDGVLLANDKQMAIGAEELLLYLLDNHELYWLTTHVKGDTDWVKRYLSDYFPPTILARLDEIRVTNWDTAKSEGIDFSQPFLWLDDDCYPDERAELEQRGVLENWVEIDLAKDPEQLNKVIDSIQARA